MSQFEALLPIHFESNERPQLLDLLIPMTIKMSASSPDGDRASPKGCRERQTSKGCQRIEDAGDYVRLEVETALKRDEIQQPRQS